MFIIYFIVGLFGAAIYFLISLCCIHYGYNEILSSHFGFFIAFFATYYFHTKYTFKGSFSAKTFIRFFSVQYSSFLLAIVIRSQFETNNSFFGIIIIGVSMMFFTFIANKIWTYKETI